MPGPYAHLTLLHELIQPARLGAVFSASSGFAAIIEDYFPYCALGAVSPDYPNLADRDFATQWADVMHCNRASDMITSGIGLLRGETGVAWAKQVAWLLGYCSHLAADLTIHPVVEAKVGVYAENQRQHRVCEMHQDSYIYGRVGQGEIGDNDTFAASVAQCCGQVNGELDGAVVSLWSGMLADVHPCLFSAHSPDCVAWHSQFMTIVEGSTRSKVRLFPLAQRISTRIELSYPAHAAVDRQFVDALTVPAKERYLLGYDDIFDLAVYNAGKLWKRVERAVCSSVEPPRFTKWNLDTGRDEEGRLVFW